MKGKGWRVDWNDKEVLERVNQATRKGIDETTHACVPVAMSLVRVRYGILRGSLQARPAQHEPGRGWVGLWGSFDVNYALWQEIIHFRYAGHRPYLRPAADQVYPTLPERIRKHLP